jgi:hypothetical protein
LKNDTNIYEKGKKRKEDSAKWHPEMSIEGVEIVNNFETDYKGIGQQTIDEPSPFFALIGE